MIPQANTYWFYSQIFWISISFGIFISLMYSFFIPWIKQSIFVRTSYIRKLEDSVEELNNKILKDSKRIEEYESSMKNILDENIAKLNQEIENQHSREKNEIDAKYEVILKKHMNDLEKWQNDFMEKLKPHVKHIVSEVRNKICY
ncbi:hypothetical protein FZC35_01370 [Candidatus Cytomitobacter indipagum]|uniref:Uncharacterized protein n=2 Tax=Candidatus Cytomitobacter indipagum TaxID=2601575 RepID=A0A5C0UEE5_9PROT|nr:hypothetical protein [Candidatus Cytomitobacter indipagum]QEK38023.1 hypothetical protein FZC35_01370 [Candidatus Cytomitobacter indipagum]